MCRRLREQARSHIFDLRLTWIFQAQHDPCGSEPARDSGGSVNIFVECAAAIASKPAPTFLICG